MSYTHGYYCMCNVYDNYIIIYKCARDKKKLFNLDWFILSLLCIIINKLNVVKKKYHKKHFRLNCALLTICVLFSINVTLLRLKCQNLDVLNKQTK